MRVLLAAAGPLRALPALLLVPLLAAACSVGSGASFDPATPCTADGQWEGAYPELESALPSTFKGQSPERRDSGRNCTEAALGTLATHGIHELHFAGALWETGKRSGVRFAVFQAPGLTADRLTEFYETGARQGRKTTEPSVRRVKLEGVWGQRLDTLNDESYQSIVLFDSPSDDLVRAILVASDVREVETRQAHEALVRRAAEAALEP